MAVPLLVIGAYLLYRERGAWPYFAGIGLAFGLLGLLWPAVLDKVEVVWMWLAVKIQIVMTTLILSLVFYLIITPIGLAFKISGRDVLHLKRQVSSSFWKKADREGSAARPRKPF